jgi:molybdopterin converting factor small subunit
MQVTVKLFATFREGRFRTAVRELPAGSTVGDLVAALGLPTAKLGVLLVNGRHVELDQELREGDTCAIFPKVGGG